MTSQTQWALMWKQGCSVPHIQTLESALSKYREHYRDDTKPNGWVPLYIGSRDDCSRAADAIRGTLIERAPKKLDLELLSLL